MACSEKSPSLSLDNRVQPEKSPALRLPDDDRVLSYELGAFVFKKLV